MVEPTLDARQEMDLVSFSVADSWARRPGTRSRAANENGFIEFERYLLP